MTCETCKNQCDCKSSEAFTRLPKFGDTKGSEYEPDTMTDSEIVKALEDAEYKVNGVVTQGVYLSVEKPADPEPEKPGDNVEATGDFDTMGTTVLMMVSFALVSVVLVLKKRNNVA